MNFTNYEKSKGEGIQCTVLEAVIKYHTKQEH